MCTQPHRPPLLVLFDSLNMRDVTLSVENIGLLQKALSYRSNESYPLTSPPSPSSAPFDTHRSNTRSMTPSLTEVLHQTPIRSLDVKLEPDRRGEARTRIK